MCYTLCEDICTDLESFLNRMTRIGGANDSLKVLNGYTLLELFLVIVPREHDKVQKFPKTYD